MTAMLEMAFNEASKLPDIEQNALARWVIDEIESDRKWDRAFADSENLLEQMALEALDEEEQGKTSEIDAERM